MASPRDALSQRDKFMLALGLFIDEFAAAEKNLKELVAATAYMKDEMRRALLSGARVDACMDLVRRIYRAHGHEPPEHLERVFAHLTAINAARNLILHYGHVRTYRLPKAGETLRDQEYHAVAADWSVSIGPGRHIPFTKEILEQMTADVDRIVTITRIQIESHEDKKPSRWKEMLALVQEPWRYTPPSPAKQNPKKRPDKTPRP